MLTLSHPSAGTGVRAQLDAGPPGCIREAQRRVMRVLTLLGTLPNHPHTRSLRSALTPGILFVSKEQFEDQARQILRFAGDVRGKLAARGVKLPV